MSYILDALKKADAERERSAVPGLHAHPLDGLAGAPPGERSLPWRPLALGAIVVLGGALAWVLLADGGARTPPAAPSVATPQAPATTADNTAAAPPVAEPPARDIPPAAPDAGAPPTVVVRAPEPPPMPARPAPAPDSAAPAAARTAQPSAAPAPNPSAPPSSSRLPTLAELPADVRASLPPLAVSGAVYSPTPSARMVFIGGQVLREGDAVAKGVTVERIGPSSTVISAHGQRFELKH